MLFAWLQTRFFQRKLLKNNNLKDFQLALRQALAQVDL